MNLIDEIQTVVKRLEDIRNLQIPDLDYIREQVDDIEYTLIPQLEKLFDDYRETNNEEVGFDERLTSRIDEIEEYFVKAHRLLLDIRPSV